MWITRLSKHCANVMGNGDSGSENNGASGEAKQSETIEDGDHERVTLVMKWPPASDSTLCDWHGYSQQHQNQGHHALLTLNSIHHSESYSHHQHHPSTSDSPYSQLRLEPIGVQPLAFSSTPLLLL